MISRASLFNKGIYKSTVRRNIWGSVLYFILLFLMTSMPLISDLDTPTSYLFQAGRPAVYRSSFMQSVIVVAIIVPTVVAMLVYRFIHSKKTSVFMHSLPVSRTANYISTLAAAFTLMAAPVVVNGIVLAVLSLAAYSNNYSIVNCLVWVGMNLMCQFVMFSLATFSAMITGNTFATPVLNILLHVFPITVVSCLSVVSQNFLFGYSTDNSVINAVAEANPAMWIGSLATRLGGTGAAAAASRAKLISKIPWYIVGSVVLYVCSWLLYKKRGMETAEDVAAFKVLNPVFRYSVTAVGTLAVYAVFNTFFYENMAVFWTILIILSAVIYFAGEMLLKKSLRVWKAYKGYLGFGVVFAAVLCVFAFTSFFGYETNVPKADEVEKVALYSYYYNEEPPYVDNPEIIEYIVNTHGKLVSEENITAFDRQEYDTRIHFNYKLKNGKTLSRAYKVKNDVNYKAMTDLYRYDEYVRANEGIFREEELNRISLHNADIEITDKAKAKELLACIQKDMLELEYKEINVNVSHWELSLEAAYELPENDGTEAAVAVEYADTYYERSARITFEHVSVNANYTNTINWLRTNGYEDALRLTINAPVHIVDMSDYNSEEITDKTLTEYAAESLDYTEISDPEKLKLLSDFVVDTKMVNDAERTYEYIIYKDELNGNNDINVITRMDEENIQKLMEIIGG